MKLKTISFKKSKANFDKLLEFFEAIVFEFFNFRFTELQLSVARELIFRTLMRKRYTISLSACRQIGKTETICFTTWFLTYIFPIIENEPFKVIVTAPDEKTGAEFYDRLKTLFDKCEARMPDMFSFKEKNKDKILLNDGSKIQVYGLFKNFARREDKKSTKEGRTCHLVIRDEKHLGEDSIFSDDVEPAMATTGGVDVWIGNGGFRNCKAKEISERQEHSTTTCFNFDYKLMRVEMKKEYKKTGNRLFMRWFESQDKYIEEHGEDSPEVRKNLFNEWIVEVGNFTRIEALLKLRREKDPDFWDSKFCDVGIDWAKEHDETVLTITDYHCNIRDWAIFRGEYPDQVDEIAEYLHGFAEKNDVQLMNIFCDGTGAGDPNVSMLKRKTRLRVRGIPFTSQSKDKLGKKGRNALTAKTESELLSYPANHKYTRKFEDQMKKLQKEYSDAGLLKYHHPKENNAHDDFPDSLFLSLWKIKKINKTRAHSKKTI